MLTSFSSAHGQLRFLFRSTISHFHELQQALSTILGIQDTIRRIDRFTSRRVQFLRRCDCLLHASRPSTLKARHVAFVVSSICPPLIKGPKFVGEARNFLRFFKTDELSRFQNDIQQCKLEVVAEITRALHQTNFQEQQLQLIDRGSIFVLALLNQTKQNEGGGYKPTSENLVRDPLFIHRNGHISKWNRISEARPIKWAFKIQLYHSEQTRFHKKLWLYN